MTIIVHQRAVEPTRSSSKSFKWSAEAIVNGRTYTATSRVAPANDIARQLVADGVPDAPMHVYTAGLRGCIIWQSFHKAAERTIKENAQTPVRKARWRAPQDTAQHGPAAQKQGVFDDNRAGVALTPSARPTASLDIV